MTTSPHGEKDCAGMPRFDIRKPDHSDRAALSKLDASQRMAYLREALADRAWRRQERAATDTPGLIAALRRKWLRLYVPRLYSVRHDLGTDPGVRAVATRVFENEAFRKSAKTALALAVAVFVGWGPMQRLMQTSSVEAIVNAHLITLRAPIDGEVVADPASLPVGATLASGTPLMTISNRRADRVRLDDLRATIGQLEDERTILKMRLANATEAQAELLEQIRLFRDGRIQQLEARLAELRSDLLAAQAQHVAASAGLKRTAALQAKGIQTQITMEKATSENEVTSQSVAAIRHRMRGIQVELAAVRSGHFLGDSYNDRPNSSQRADELKQKIAEFNADIRQRDIRLERLGGELRAEQARYSDLAAATIIAPSTGKVWEVLTAPGEEVRRGQELARMLDCNSAVVTATVAESVYNRLQVGQPAKFRFRDGGPELDGRIVHLTGVAAAPANLAIAPSALTREAYRVTVAVPKLMQPGRCDLGRTGRVIFGSDTATRGT